jgi:hypothetical protein
MRTWLDWCAVRPDQETRVMALRDTISNRTEQEAVEANDRAAWLKWRGPVNGVRDAQWSSRGTHAMIDSEVVKMERGGKRPGAGRKKSRQGASGAQHGSYQPVPLSDYSPQEIVRLYKLMQRVAATSGTLTDRDAFERLQGIFRAALVQFKHDPANSNDPVSGVVGEAFYRGWRNALLAAGATEADIEAMAYLNVLRVVDSTERGSEEREQQFELIAHHLACTDMTVRIRPDDTNVRVEFPDRPMRH